MKRGTVTDTGNLELGVVGEERDGTWVLQVTGFPGLTSLTPQLTLNGTDWVAASVRAAATPGTFATTITANGLYYFDAPSKTRARLLGAGTGTVTVEAAGSQR